MRPPPKKIEHPDNSLGAEVGYPQYSGPVSALLPYTVGADTHVELPRLKNTPGPSVWGQPGVP